MMIRKQHILKHTLCVLLLLGLAACSGDVSDNIQRSLEPVPNAYGNLGDIAVIGDTALVASPVGDTLDYYFGAAYPILPQPEPIFDLRYYSPWNLQATPAVRELRTFIIVADLTDEDSPTTRMVFDDIGTERLRRDNLGKEFGTTVGRDKWAKGQLLVYMYGYGRAALEQNIKDNFSAIIKRIYQSEAGKRDAAIYFGGENRAVIDQLNEALNVSIRLPASYKLAMQEEATNMYWLRNEQNESSSNIMLRSIPYENQEQISREGIKAIRDSLGKYVTSAAPDSYMVINDVDLPMYVNTTTLNGAYALEAKGIWELENDFMGGPFLSYLIYNPEKRNLLFVDGFVHAPGEDKRELMQAIEYVLQTIKY